MDIYSQALEALDNLNDAWMGANLSGTEEGLLGGLFGGSDGCGGWLRCLIINRQIEKLESQALDILTSSSPFDSASMAKAAELLGEILSLRAEFDKCCGHMVVNP